MGDIVIYMTIQGKYYPYTERHHRIVAILQVEDIYTTHQEGEAAYSNLNIKLPSNCMTVGNLPFDFDKTASNYQTEKEIKKYLLRDQQTQTKIGEQRLKLWDSNYFWKSKKWPCFIRTKALYRNLINPVPIYRQDFVSIFGKLPNTRTANKISEMQFIKLSKLIGLNISLGERIYDKNDKRE
ncbi:MAG: hypothetical protein EOO20_03510 [Chryseobacterium sp.]|nr:MAG: hypothetical protein EOO20_03510 [Chryseobacterium sp.]